MWGPSFVLSILYLPLNEKGNGQNGDQAESSKSQRTSMVSSPSAEVSLPRSLCPEMCMICKKKDLKLKHSRQLQSKIVTRTSEKTLKKAAFT